MEERGGRGGSSFITVMNGPRVAKDLLVIPSLRIEYYSSIESNKERWKWCCFNHAFLYSLDEWQFFKSGLGVYYQLPEERELNDLSEIQI